MQRHFATPVAILFLFLALAMTGCRKTRTVPAIPPTNPIAEKPKDKDKEKEKEKKVVPARSDVIVIRADELARDYTEDRDAAEQKYKGKVLEVDGVIDHPALKDGGGHPAIKLEGVSTKHVEPAVRCSFAPASREKAGDVIKGQPIKVRGKCQGMVVVSIELRECALLDVQPAPINNSAVELEIRTAGEDVSLEKIDFSLGGMDLTLAVPEGAKVKEAGDAVFITAGERFAVKIVRGRGEFHQGKANLNPDRLMANSDRLALGRLGAGSYRFSAAVVAGYQDYSGENVSMGGDKPVPHTKEDCLLMVRCLRTLEPKNSPATEAQDALDQLGANVTLDNNDKVTKVRFYPKTTTDTTVSLVRSFVDLQELALVGAITDDALVHVRRLVNLRKLELKDTGITGTGLGHLENMKKLKVLDLSRTKVNDAALESLQGLVALEELDLRNTVVTDSGVQKLQRALPKTKILR